MQFCQLAEVFDRLESTSSRLEMTDILSDFFRKVEPSELRQMIYLSVGRLHPEFYPQELGMADKPPVTAFGQAGYDFGCYKTPIGNQQLYQKLPVLEPHTIRYVEFCPVVNCDFDPELLLFVADLPQADILMRATSYISGDLWESRSSPVLSCAWMYAYPIISGKVNHITTGFYHGLKRRKAYPPGLRMIAVPFQKMPEFFRALEEMDWTLIAFREDEGSRAELARRMAHWQEMAAADGSTVDLR